MIALRHTLSANKMMSVSNVRSTPYKSTKTLFPFFTSIEAFWENVLKNRSKSQKITQNREKYREKENPSYILFTS